jgi:hypothetical protein
MLARSERAVEIAFSGKRSMSLAQIASAQGQVFWPSIDRACMRLNLQDCKAGITGHDDRHLYYVLLFYCIFHSAPNISWTHYMIRHGSGDRAPLGPDPLQAI